MLRIINGGVDASPMMTPDRLELLLGIRADQYRDYAALRGDPSDNLPGVRGIGPRSAARLLAEFGSARAAFDDLDAVRSRVAPGVAARLGADGARAAWELNCRVMAMREDVPLGLDLTVGPGVLPFAAEAVAETFRAHNLTWSAGQAIRVLAEVEPGPPPADPPESEHRQGQAEWWWHTNTARRLPRLPARSPAVEQLSLF